MLFFCSQFPFAPFKNSLIFIVGYNSKIVRPSIWGFHFISIFSFNEIIGITISEFNNIFILAIIYPLLNLTVSFIFIIITLLIIVSIGIFGYSVIEGWALLDSVYMVIITLFTVGFQEVQPLSSEGKIFTIFLILTGVGASIYVAGQIIEIIVEGQILGIRRRKKMENTIRNLKDHFIICGFGRVGHQVGKEFDAANIKYVVIDNDPENAKKYEEENIHYIIGDATSDDKLHEAGITKAKGLVACSDSDIANVYVTLSARTLNKKPAHCFTRQQKRY